MVTQARPPALCADRQPVSHYRITRPPEKFPPADNLPAAARAGRIFIGKLSAGGDFTGWGGNSIMGRHFYGAGDSLIRGDISVPWLSLPEKFFHGRDILIWHRLSRTYRTPRSTAAERALFRCYYCCCSCWLSSTKHSRAFITQLTVPIHCCTANSWRR